MPTFNLTTGADVFPGAGVNTRGDDEIFSLEGNDQVSSGHGADTVHGGEGDDLLKGGAGADALNGDDGADRLYGGLDDDTLNGGLGADTLWGQDGHDTLNGGDGDDLMIGGAGADLFNGGEGFDTVSYRYVAGGVGLNLSGTGSTGEAIGDSFVSVERLLLSTSIDIVYLGDAGMTVLAYGGGDAVIGGAGDDMIYGGDGGDQIYGGDGDDRLVGDADADTLYGDAGDDAILDASGNTYAYGGDGSDRITIAEGFGYGGADNDTLTATGGGVTRLYGDEGNDRLYGSSVVNSTNELYGGDGDDALYANARYARLDGGAGADRIYTFGGASVYGEDGDDWTQSTRSTAGDTIFGGAGFDTVSWSNADGAVTVEGAGADFLGTAGRATNDGMLSIEAFELSAYGDTFRGDFGTSAATVFGGDGADWLHGGAGADTFWGQDGDDVIQAGDGNDVIRGGDGYDNLHGQGGDDLIFGNGTDQVVGGDGNDRLFLYADMDNQWSNHVFGDGGDDVIVLGGDTVEAHGGSGADTIYGSAEATGEGIDGGDGDDVIYGRAASGNYYGDDLGGSMSGNDRILVDGAGGLYGGNGDDYLQGSANAATQNQYLGGNGIDTVSYRNAGAGVSLYFNYQAGNLGAAAGDYLDSIERLHLTDFNDVLTLQGVSWPGTMIEARGYGGNDYFQGDGGEEHFFGGEGDDSLYGLGGDDFLYGGEGSDTMGGGAGTDHLFGNAGHDYLYGGDDDDLLYGGLGIDHVYGDAGDDVIDGGGRGSGESQRDSLYGGAGADTFIFQVGYGAAEVTDFAWGEDRLDVSTFVAASHDWNIVDYGGAAEVVFATGDSITFLNMTASVLQQVMDEATGPGDVFEPMAPPSPLNADSYGDGELAGPRFVLGGGEWFIAG